MLYSLLGIWLEIVFAGKAEGTDIELPTGGLSALGKVDGGVVQAVRRGVPLGKAVAELVGCTQGKAKHMKVVTGVSDLQLQPLLPPLSPAAPAGGQVRWHRVTSQATARQRDNGRTVFPGSRIAKGFRCFPPACKVFLFLYSFLRNKKISKPLPISSHSDFAVRAGFAVVHFIKLNCSIYSVLQCFCFTKIFMKYYFEN